MSRYLSLLGQAASNIGSVAASEQWRGGPLEVFYGFKLIPTIKAEVLNGAHGAGRQVGVFAPEQYLGQFYSLQDPTVYLKAEKDMIEFSAYEAVGMGIGNVRGFVLGDFEEATTAP